MLNIKNKISKITYCSLTLAGISLIAACGGSGNSSNNENSNNDISPPEQINNCFWGGPYNIDNPNSNFAYPDTGATYWHAKYTLPEGARLKLKGEFPYARYMSFNSYRLDASPAHALGDLQILAETGSINPFSQGAERNSPHRSYSINLISGEAPESPAPNTLYDYAGEDGSATLLYRVYVPNKGKNATGGTGLPQAKLTLSNGEILTGQAACDSLQSDQELLSIPLVPEQTYKQLRQFNPAKESPIWRAAYNVQFNLQCAFLGRCSGTPERQVGWFANLDNQYLATYLDRSIKPIAVIRGKIPKVPSTLNNDEIFDQSQAQLRYWSICQNEYYSQKVTACLYDEQVTINPDGYFTIVTSVENQRPDNATEECGIGFLPWSEQGDGFSIIPGQENNENDALLIMRNMLPINNFEETIQRTSTPGDEADILGDFMPSVQYFTKEEFEDLGCDVYNSLPQ